MSQEEKSRYSYPEDLTDLVWNWYTTDKFGRLARRPASKESLAKLINEAYAASLQVEEGRPVRLQLIIRHHPNQVTARFKGPLPYTARNLVKLAPTIDLGFRWLIVAPAKSGDDSLEIIGICDPKLSPAANDPKRSLGGDLLAHQQDPSGMKMSVLGPGYIRIEAGLFFFQLRNCRLRRPHSMDRIHSVVEWTKEVAKSFDFSGMQVDSSADEEPKVARESGRVLVAQGLVRRTLGSILSKVSYARHGGTILVIPEDADVSGIVRLKYTLPTGVLRSCIEKRASFSMKSSDLDQAHFSERDLARTSDLLASFTAVDGAVILRRDLTLLGYGAEILGNAPPSIDDEVEHVVDGVDQGEIRLDHFGMRHRSASRFCRKIERSIAFVVSQDGDLRVFCNESGKVSLYEGSTPESWVISPPLESSGEGK